jgi:hypothetical protein
MASPQPQTLGAGVGEGASAEAPKPVHVQRAMSLAQRSKKKVFHSQNLAKEYWEFELLGVKNLPANQHLMLTCIVNLGANKEITTKKFEKTAAKRELTWGPGSLGNLRLRQSAVILHQSLRVDLIVHRAWLGPYVLASFSTVMDQDAARGVWKDIWLSAEHTDPKVVASLPELHIRIRFTSISKKMEAQEQLAFFRSVKGQTTGGGGLDRDYAVLVDSSGSMYGEKWVQAVEVLEALARPVAAADADGITLGFFSDYLEIVPNVTDPAQVLALFQERTPYGSSCLAEALKTIIDPWLLQLKDPQVPSPKPLTLLVITDGEPNNQLEVEAYIVSVTQQMHEDQQLSISFIQVGDDHNATHYLTNLDNKLVLDGAPFDIVDTVQADDLHQMDFASLIAKSILD